MGYGGETFYDVDERVRERCVFTTHTPVPAAQDVFLCRPDRTPSLRNTGPS